MLVIMIWILRYITAVAFGFIVWVGFHGIPIIIMMAIPMGALHVATWLAWRKD